jgi:hypothetical protein
MNTPSIPTTEDAPVHGLCIYMNTHFQGPTLAVRDDDRPCVFATEREAQLEMVEFAMTRLRQFIDGERDLQDAITIQEFVVPVTLVSDGSVRDEHGRCFGLE